MQVKKAFSLLLALMVCMSSFNMTAMAVVVGTQVEADAVRATGHFSMDVPKETIVRASSSFSLEAGEMVTIKASYTPFSASVDFGLIAEDGYFYYINTNNGSFDKTIKVEERGNYTFAVMNDSDKIISVSGYVNF